MSRRGRCGLFPAPRRLGATSRRTAFLRRARDALRVAASLRLTVDGLVVAGEGQQIGDGRLVEAAKVTERDGRPAGGKEPQTGNRGGDDINFRVGDLLERLRENQGEIEGHKF